jgi:hypothetical protein
MSLRVVVVGFMMRLGCLVAYTGRRASIRRECGNVGISILVGEARDYEEYVLGDDVMVTKRACFAAGQAQ